MDNVYYINLIPRIYCKRMTSEKITGKYPISGMRSVAPLDCTMLHSIQDCIQRDVVNYLPNELIILSFLNARNDLRVDAVIQFWAKFPLYHQDQLTWRQNQLKTYSIDVDQEISSFRFANSAIA